MNFAAMDRGIGFGAALAGADCIMKPWQCNDLK